MQPSGYFVDANLLVLLVVGNVDSEHVSKYKRTKLYTVQDYKKLSQILGGNRQILLTPNILTETSNLLCHDKRMVAMLRQMIQSPHVKEVYVESRTAAKRDEFERLGLADCVLLEVITPETPLLTADFALMRAALTFDPSIVTYFSPHNL